MSTKTTLIITKERVLEAASKCSTAKETLKTLFPEAFHNPNAVDLNTGYGESGYLDVKTGTTPEFLKRGKIQIRKSGNYENQAFYLDTEDYDWELVHDDEDQLVLLPTNK